MPAPSRIATLSWSYMKGLQARIAELKGRSSKHEHVEDQFLDPEPIVKDDA